MRAPAKICGGAARQSKAVPLPQDDGETVPCRGAQGKFCAHFAATSAIFLHKRDLARGRKAAKKTPIYKRNEQGGAKEHCPAGC